MHLALAISKYELENTWLWKTPGVLGSLVSLGDNLAVNLDPNGLLTAIDINNGDILYTFNYNSQESQIKGLKDSQFAIFNGRKIDFWNIYTNDLFNLDAFMTKQVTADSQIINLQLLNEDIYILQEDRIQIVGLNSKDLTSMVDLPLGLAKGKVVKDFLSGALIVIGEDKNNDPVVINLETNKSNYFNGCRFSEMDVDVSIEVNVICHNEVLYQLDGGLNLIELRRKPNLLSPDVVATSLIDDVIVSIESIDNYKVVQSEGSMYILNKEISDSRILSSFSLPLAFKNSSNHSFIFKDEGVNVYLFISTDRGMLKCYRNGAFKWSIDQSFSAIKKAIVVSDEEQVVHLEHANYNESWITKLMDSIIYVFTVFSEIETHQNDELFGFNKLLLVLTENNKIGIFKLQKQLKSQLVKVIDLDFTIDDIVEIKDVVYLFSSGTTYKLDIIEGKAEVSLENSQFPLFELNHLATGYTTEIKDKEINGVFYNMGESHATWKHHINGEFVSLLKRSYGNSDVAQSAIVLPTRDVLYKYLIPNLTALITLKDEKINIDLMSVITGEKLGGWMKPYKGSIDKINSIFEENYIILTLQYNSSIDESEVVVIDLYESLEPNERFTNPNNIFDSFNSIPLPAFAMQSFIIGDSIDCITISETKNNIAQRALLIQTHGEVHIIPKYVIDARRGGIVGDFKDEKFVMKSISSHPYSEKISHSWKYDPALNLSPKLQLTNTLDITSNGKGQILTVSTNLSSTSYLISITNDIFVTMIQPSGSFDKLTSDFKSNIILTAIVTLIILTILFHSKNTNKIRWVI